MPRFGDDREALYLRRRYYLALGEMPVKCSIQLIRPENRAKLLSRDLKKKNHGEEYTAA